ncbi:hypothetical protein GJ698_29715 [Pseudoduganella sp. FT26W]|uniref:Methyltransferase FkbM domain-containing protein n=1 Tax=Duganella aquatilis TaxID=2666082 RepID=A0A844DFE8_9BURK|nr:FkbM family methyltransferase [Duganella aquatilis]MRW88262.1 hypothetical protein [Duganella aquatilis]
MSLTSYAHNCEDVLLMRALGHIEHGRYLDAAAGDPLHSNATQAFYARGWHGVNLETAPALLRRLRIARPADTNLALAAAAAPGQRAWYQVELPGASTFDAALAQQQRDAGRAVVQHLVELQTLNAICEQHLDGELHFLRLADSAALAGLDLQRWRPWIIVLRADGVTPLDALLAARYRLAYADGYNQFYLADEQAALAAALTLPPHPADDFVLAEDHHYSHPLAEWRRRTAEAEAASQESRIWAQAHVREWREKFERLDAEQQRANRAEQQLAEMSGRAHRAEAQLPHLNARAAAADVAEQTLGAVYASLSWRLTRPLREGKFKLAKLRAWLRAFPRRVVGAVLRRVKGLAGYALRYVNARPKLSFFLRRNIARLPFMVPLMRALKLRLQLNHTHAAAAAPVPADLDSLPEAARQVFDDLRRARRQAPHS